MKLQERTTARSAWVERYNPYSGRTTMKNIRFLNTLPNKKEKQWKWGDLLAILKGSLYEAGHNETATRRMEEGGNFIISFFSNQYTPKRIMWTISTTLKSMTTSKNAVFILNEKVELTLLQAAIHHLPEQSGNDNHDQ